MYCTYDNSNENVEHLLVSNKKLEYFVVVLLDVV